MIIFLCFFYLVTSFLATKLKSHLIFSSRESRRRKRSLVQQDSIVEPQADDEELPKVDGLRILKTNGPEWFYILLGAVASVIMGASMPVYAILFGEVNSFQSFTEEGDSTEKLI